MCVSTLTLQSSFANENGLGVERISRDIVLTQTFSENIDDVICQLGCLVIISFAALSRPIFMTIQ